MRREPRPCLMLLAAPLAVAALALGSGSPQAASGSTRTSSSPTAHPVGDRGTAATDATATDRPAAPVVDRPVEPYRLELLELAFDAASAMPVEPHIKTRSRLQHSVVEACLDLDQPRRALACAERIGNWRRGLGFAQFAAYCAERGDRSETAHSLREAERISYSVDEWRRDRIRASIAEALIWLGFSDAALDFESGLVDSEAGRANRTRVELMDEGQFEQTLLGVDHTILDGSFDVVKNTLIVCVRLFDRFYGDETRRARVEETITSSWTKMPVMIRIELMMEMAQAALDHGDKAKALALVEQAQPMLDAGNWIPEYHVPFRGRLAALRGAAGDTAKARAEIAKALGMYETRTREIADVFRARALRPLAEALHRTGDREAALAMYKRLVEAGVENPNSRPRAEDLAATCVSLAVQAFEPDEELEARLRAIREGLGHPW